MSKFLKIEYGVGETSLDSCYKLAKHIDLTGNLFIKREDLNPTGSYKDRSLSVWISNILETKPESHFVISSSGNAAIAAAASCIIAGRSLTIYLSENVESKKMQRLKQLLSGDLKVGKWQFKKLAVNLQQYPFRKIKDDPIIVRQNEIDEAYLALTKRIKIVQTKQPKKMAMQAAEDKNVVVLRGSMDDEASVGYEKLAAELVEQTKGKISDIFLPSSSGVGAIGIHNGFTKLQDDQKIAQIPRFYVCQTIHCYALVRNMVKNKPEKKEEMTITPAICDRIAYQRKKVEQIIEKTGGAGLVMNNTEIRNASYILNKFGQTSGIEGALAMAGLIKAKADNMELGGNVVIMNTGA